MKLKNVILLESLLEENERKINKKLSLPVIIMAGGIGSRMEPFTKVLPKPLIPVNGKPIIEHIIDNFLQNGCSDFHLTINYKSKILRAYFSELKKDYSISFQEEKKPLGTAGSLKFFSGKFDKPIFITNCDIIVKTDYNSFYDFHIDGNFDISLVASMKQYEIPYGTCELDSNGNLFKIDEKPSYNFLVNTGLYIINPDLLNIIPNDKFFDITTLIKKCKEINKKVGVYPVGDDSWIDVGQWDEFRLASKRLS